LKARREWQDCARHLKLPGMPAPGHQMLALWRRLSPLPGGKWLFSRLIRISVPYSASVRPQVQIVEPGHARVAIRDRHAVRNHLRSVHAIALANVGELASGLAMTTALPPSVRGIVVRLRIEYVKKASGTLIAESTCVIPAVTADEDHDFETTITDAAGDVVARVIATWRLGPARRT
jgi:acyl-coenzyme A thioesterase PaaI-like protein